ncbi:unnamed protein product [Lupinus luteus]|uniref:Uncharacterized protein n=1 Tax=Lupinus luteus TaxID=3873 RepID=A0AAV1WV19_LUPLU
MDYAIDSSSREYDSLAQCTKKVKTRDNHVELETVMDMVEDDISHGQDQRISYKDKLLNLPGDKDGGPSAFEEEDLVENCYFQERPPSSIEVALAVNKLNDEPPPKVSVVAPILENPGVEEMTTPCAPMGPPSSNEDELTPTNIYEACLISTSNDDPFFGQWMLVRKNKSWCKNKGSKEDQEIELKKN